jgi:hypothetical protein
VAVEARDQIELLLEVLVAVEMDIMMPDQLFLLVEQII